MPEYNYRAVTRTGVIVKNRIEASSRFTLIKALKRSDLLPISIEQVSYRSRRNKQKKQKRNVTNIDDVMKNVNTSQLKSKRRTLTTKEKINLYFARTEKITTRDIVVFTQYFYLLKKANFNNIHALNTIIDSTENVSFRGILEDILAGVEARRKYVYNNGILLKCISIHIHKYDKSWRAIRFTYKLSRASC